VRIGPPPFLETDKILLGDRIHGAEFQIYPGLSHGFIVEARQEVVKRILSFLAGKD